MRVERGGRGAKVGLGGVGGITLARTSALCCNSSSVQLSSNVPLALADEVRKWPISFEATIGADVLQNTQNSAGIG
jgi:hypothetical protein